MKSCGTCKWYAAYGDFAPDKGTCAFPLPVWLHDDVSRIDENTGPSPMSANIRITCAAWTEADVVEFNLEQVVLKPQPDKRAVFVARLSDATTEQTARQATEMWDYMWKLAGYDRSESPLLMIVAKGITLQALTDAELESAGLMRIPREA